MEATHVFPWLLVPAIFFARVFDVSLGTFRTIIAFRGYRFLALVIGFVESTVWVLAISQVISNLDHWMLILAYASGFACGTWVGISLESRVGIGSELIRAISFSGRGRLASHLRQVGYSAINLEGDAGSSENVEVVLVVEKRKEMPRLIQAIREVDPDAVLTITDVKSVHSPALPSVHTGPAIRGGWRKQARRK